MQDAVLSWLADVLGLSVAAIVGLGAAALVLRSAVSKAAELFVANSIENVRALHASSLEQMRIDFERERDRFIAEKDRSMIRYTRLHEQQADAIGELHDLVDSTIDAARSLAEHLKETGGSILFPSTTQQQERGVELEQALYSSLETLAKVYRKKRLLFDSRFDERVKHLAVAVSGGVEQFRDRIKDFQMRELEVMLRIYAEAERSAPDEGASFEEFDPFDGVGPEVDLEGTLATIMSRLHRLSDELVTYFREVLGVEDRDRPGTANG